MQTELTADNGMTMSLKPCPFCGCQAEIKADDTARSNFVIIGCSTEYEMLCPDPSFIAYCQGGRINVDGWNTRHGS